MLKDIKKPTLYLVMVGVALLALGWTITHFHNRPIGVDEVWNMYYRGKSLEGKTLTIKGDVVFDPQPEYPFLDLYLVDSNTSSDQRVAGASYAHWFGIGVPEFTCESIETQITCYPFNPDQVGQFELKGTLYLIPSGKRPLIFLANIDFEQSRQFVNESWQPIELEEIVIREND